MSRRHYCDNTHLSLQDRMTIQFGIENNSTKVAIAKTLGKDPTTIAKEIKKHRIFKPRRKFNSDTDCTLLSRCKRCTKSKKCENYQEPRCCRRDKSPGACNKCPKISNCRMKKYVYDANIAHEFYRKTLVDSREGINLEASEFQALVEVIAPLIKQGQSIYQILLAHPEIKVSERTIYNYIDQGLFKPYGVDYFSLKEKVQRKQPKTRYKKRNESAAFENHRHQDYLGFRNDNPDIPVVQMDTVYNDPSGPYIQTFLFEGTNFMIGFIHQEKTATSMANTLDDLEKLLGEDTFTNLFPLILTDRGPEFSKPELFEFSSKTGEMRLNIFYCDPLQATQKAIIENNHNYLRDIIPNGVCLDKLSNQDLQLVFSHINNTPRRSLNDKSPYQLFEFIYSSEVTALLNIKKLQPDEVILNPSLLKLRKK